MTDANGPFCKIDLEFRYQHGFGGLEPFFRALGEGRLVGTRCETCGTLFCPPRLACPSGHWVVRWVDVPATGVVDAVTHGPGRVPLGGPEGPMAWALVRLDGCHNRAVARLADGGRDVSSGARVQLVLPDERPVHPIQLLVFAPVAP